jgi:D-glycero-D-manno-heptose 1,7-bisphosphate phosphatase
MKLSSVINGDWTLFLDRDGVINKRVYGGYITKVEDFHFIEGVLEKFSVLNSLFKNVIVVTNQQGVSKGLMCIEDLEDIHNYMLYKLEEHNGYISKVYVATGLKNEHDFQRKPNPYMGLQAKSDFPEIIFSKSIMVGDTDSDILFGSNLGMMTVRIDDGVEPINFTADFIFKSLEEFCNYLNQLN